MRIRPGLATKHFLLLFATTFVLFFLLSWLNLRESRLALERKSLDEASLLVSKTNQYLDLYTESVRSLFLFLQIEAVTDSDQLRSLADISPLIIETLYFIQKDGTLLSSRQAAFDAVGNDFSGIGAELTDLGPGLVWSEPHYSSLSGMTISFVQKMERGVAILEIELDVLTEKVVGIAERKGITLHVTSARDATILYDRNGLFRFPLVEDDALRRALSHVPRGTSRFDWNGMEYHLIKSRANSLGWTVYAVVDPVFFSAGIEVLNRNFATFGLILFGLLLLTSVALSLIITKPVRNLSSAMDQVKSLKHLAPIANTYQDELGELVDAYNNMMSRINSLTTEKNEYEWKMLQSQIGPHFLYNTLACINALAKRNRTAEITKTIGSLVHLLKYSFDRTASDVSLGEELEVLRSYVAIENIRYGDLFSLEIRVPDEIRRLLVPALLLQPVVENAIFHGFIPENTSGRITVSAERHDNGRLSIVVADEGRGMSPDQLRSLHILLGSTDSSPNPRSDSLTGSRDRLNAIGLWNIHRRLQVHYGEEYGIRVESTPGSGTLVFLELPANIG